ncbi:YecA/YgfB family protein [Marinobacterium arenosum]|uniref:YecA/YgfB family protein n=1 Tax=Marinobacterium arenosum TaxID=2862496 RepID=UPI001C95B041|nr:YecA family protein [Marinobacterium arenosum]MBY4678723.1 YecA family protein [Marinobacterium arenosum]
MSLSVTPLTDDELDLLDDFLFSDAVSEETLDLIGVHGLLYAVNISPEPIARDEWLSVIFDEQPNWESDAQKAKIEGLLEQLNKEISASLYSDEGVDIPCDLTLEPEEGEEVSDLVIWTQAFMEGVFMREEQWFSGAHEEAAAELLLPFMVVSDLFEEPEFQKMRNDKRIAAAMCAQLPELLIDLYLLFHAPEK